MLLFLFCVAKLRLIFVTCKFFRFFSKSFFSSRSGTRTRVSTVRGWRANRYTNRPVFDCQQVLFLFDDAKLQLIFESAKFRAIFFEKICMKPWIHACPELHGHPCHVAYIPRYLLFISITSPSYAGCTFSGRRLSKSSCVSASWLRWVRYAVPGFTSAIRSRAS